MNLKEIVDIYDKTGYIRLLDYDKKYKLSDEDDRRLLEPYLNYVVTKMETELYLGVVLLAVSFKVDRGDR